VVATKLAMNILYICNPDSIHDQKWMRFFAEKNDFQVFAVGESVCNERTIEDLENQNIILLPSVDSFSIKTPLRNYQSIQKLRHYCHQYKIDLIHVLFATPYALWTNYLDKPYIITTRGSDVLRVIPSLKGQSGIRFFYFRWLLKQFAKSFKKATYITSTSQAQIDAINTFIVRSDVQLIRTGVDIKNIQEINADDYLPANLKGKKLIFSPRFFSEIYNILFILKAIEQLPNEIIQEFTFVFVKGKNYSEKYANQIDEKLVFLKEKIKLNYHVFDYLSQQEIWSVFKKCSLTINVPISDGTPNSVLEAMAAGSPIILSKLSTFDSALFNSDTVHFTDLDDPKGLTLSIKKCINNYDKQEKGFEAVSNFGNRETEMNKLNLLYCKVLKI
jgi:glycosyltransferase involved in cell wall biosynthesis